MRGLRFYAPSDPWMWLIAHVTHGPFAHVAIDLGDGTVIEAVDNGVQHDYLAPHGVFWPLPEHFDLAKADAFLQSELHSPYGWGDIVEDGLKAMGDDHPPTLDPKHFDCSDLATRYLMAGGMDVGPLARDPHTVSPNDLARFLKVGLRVR